VWHLRVVRIRRGVEDDLEELIAMRIALWPGSDADHRDDARDLLAGRPRSSMPLVVFVAEDGGRLVGFAEVGLRSHANGCDGRRPVGFLEGWWVAEARRRSGVGRALVERAEAWAREQGATEMASDTWHDNDVSVTAHQALGYAIKDRCVNFRKRLGEARFYGDHLARLHHEHHGAVARAAARELLRRLPVSSGTVVELGAGTGIFARAVGEAGFAVWGVERSAAMLALARAEAPAATYVQGSLWSADLPACVAVAAVGEVFGYATDAPASLADRLRDVHAALAPGGVLLFDVAGPGRSGPAGSRRGFWTHGATSLGLVEREDGRELTRDITMFVPDGAGLRRVEETHVLRLHAAEEVEAMLDVAGFAWERLARYDDLALAPGWHAWAAVKRSPGSP